MFTGTNLFFKSPQEINLIMIMCVKLLKNTVLQVVRMKTMFDVC